MGSHTLLENQGHGAPENRILQPQGSLEPHLHRNLTRDPVAEMSSQATPTFLSHRNCVVINSGNAAGDD